MTLSFAHLIGTTPDLSKLCFAALLFIIAFAALV
jgi:hypothetical protein